MQDGHHVGLVIEELSGLSQVTVVDRYPPRLYLKGSDTYLYLNQLAYQ